jgi:predicted metal-binding protein
VNPAAFKPRIQIFVCTHARDRSDPLASGCGSSGPSVFSALKRWVARTGKIQDVWITRAMCLGHCPRTGCAVTVHPENTHWVGVTESDVPALCAGTITGK